MELTPEYSIDPSWCPFELTITKPGNTVLDPKLSLDQTKQDVVLDQITDNVEIAGPASTDYPVLTTITTEAYDGTKTAETPIEHTVTIKNPCIDAAYMKINLPATLPNESYIV